MKIKTTQWLLHSPCFLTPIAGLFLLVEFGFLPQTSCNGATVLWSWRLRFILNICNSNTNSWQSSENSLTCKASDLFKKIHDSNTVQGTSYSDNHSLPFLHLFLLLSSFCSDTLWLLTVNGYKVSSGSNKYTISCLYKLYGKIYIQATTLSLPMQWPLFIHFD